MFYSFIIPVYNRPDEIDELLQSLTQQEYSEPFEVVVVEDGSTVTCQEIVAKYEQKLNVSYYYKANSGPGQSRNYGMERAKGSYFIILDSDCIIPPQYLMEVDNYLKQEFVACFGGPDAALDNFTTVQKAINFTMTSFLTTGGIRGGNERIGKFQPRSFNLGLSKEAFELSGGFGRIHPGEDPDLVMRLWGLGVDSQLFPNAYVFHKRRIDWKRFYTQVNKFGKARPILNYRFPAHAKLTYWFPFVFILGFGISILLLLIGSPFLVYAYLIYLGLIFISASLVEKSIKVGFFAIFAVFCQFFGYGMGFVKSYINIFVLRKKPENALPEMFF